MIGPALLLASSATVAAGDSFTCTPILVWDGDGPVWCKEGPRVRLAGIAARELDGTCRQGHPCPDASGEEARDHLVRLLGVRLDQVPTGHIAVAAKPITCISTGSAGGSRTGAWCTSPSAGDLSCAMVASGMAAKWDRYWGGHRCRED